MYNRGSAHEFYFHKKHTGGRSSLFADLKTANDEKNCSFWLFLACFRLKTAVLGFADEDFLGNVTPASSEEYLYYDRKISSYLFKVLSL